MRNFPNSPATGLSSTRRRFAQAVCLALASAAALAGCGGTSDKTKITRTYEQQDIVPAHVYPALEGTIGQYAFFADSMSMPVEGWAIVGGLPGTGSGEMTPEVREYLTQQLYRSNAGSYAKGTEQYNPELILATNQISAVEVHGLIPPMARRGDSFDLTVKALPDTQTTSIEGGLLWTAPLRLIGLRLDIDTSPVAIGRGPIYIPSIADGATTKPGNQALRTGRVLGGGIVSQDREMRLQLRSPSMRFAAAIQRAVNSRFPGREKPADAVNDSIINLHVPPQYHDAPEQFVDLVTHMYLAIDVPGFKESQVQKLTKALEDPKAPHREISLALEGLGRSILPEYLQPLYSSSNPTVRFWAGRAGAAMKDVGGLVVLEETIRDANSPLRMDAVQGVIDCSHDGDTVRATLALAELLKSENPRDRVIGYGGLVAIRSRAVHTYTIAKKMLLDIVPCDGPPLIYVTQSDTPRIALIGKGFTLPSGALFVSSDNLLTVSVLDDAAASSGTTTQPSDANVVTAAALRAPDAPPSDLSKEAARDNKNAVTLYWRSPTGDRTVNLKTSASLPDVIARLAWSPDPLASNFDPHAEYIGASYQRVVEMLSAMCADQSINAKFVLGKASDIKVTTSDSLVGRPEGSTESLSPKPAPAAPPLTAPPLDTPPPNAPPLDAPAAAPALSPH